MIGWIGLAWRVIDLFMRGAFDFEEPVQVFTNGPACGWPASA